MRNSLIFALVLSSFGHLGAGAQPVYPDKCETAAQDAAMQRHKEQVGYPVRVKVVKTVEVPEAPPGVPTYKYRISVVSSAPAYGVYEVKVSFWDGDCVPDPEIHVLEFGKR